MCISARVLAFKRHKTNSKRSPLLLLWQETRRGKVRCATAWTPQQQRQEHRRACEAVLPLLNECRGHTAIRKCCMWKKKRNRACLLWCPLPTALFGPPTSEMNPARLSSTQYFLYCRFNLIIFALCLVAVTPNFPNSQIQIISTRGRQSWQSPETSWTSDTTTTRRWEK